MEKIKLKEFTKFITENELKILEIDKIKILYDKLINYARPRGLNKLNYPKVHLEAHHITPHCLGGRDEEENLVLLTVREHIYAHLYLRYIHPEETSLEFTLNWMIPSRKSRGVIDEADFSEREKIWTSQQYRKVNIAGSIECEEYRKKQSQITSKRMKDPKNRARISQTLLARSDKSKLKLRARKVIDEQTGKIFESVSDCARHFNVTQNAIRSRIKHYDNSKWKLRFLEGPVSKGKRIQGPDGTIYNSLRDCSNKTGHTRISIRSWILQYPERGFKYLD